jgi:hypothetical protein
MAVDPSRVKSLFLAAADLADPAQRAAYLDRACGEEAELRARVEALLHDGGLSSGDRVLGGGPLNRSTYVDKPFPWGKQPAVAGWFPPAARRKPIN